MADAKIPSKKNEILAINLSFFALSWIAVGLRIWVRTSIIKAFGRDDWTMLATQLLFTGYLICQLGGLAHGTGRHLKDLEYAEAEIALMVRNLTP
jgi:hypothetical protein